MKKFILSIMFFCSFFLSSITGEAATLKGGYPACLTKDLLDQIIDAAINKDERGWKYLLQHGCIIAKAGIEVSVLDEYLWPGKAKVRAYVGDDAVILWTIIENINR